MDNVDEDLLKLKSIKELLTTGFYKLKNSLSSVQASHTVSSNNLERAMVTSTRGNTR